MRFRLTSKRDSTIAFCCKDIFYIKMSVITLIVISCCANIYLISYDLNKTPAYRKINYPQNNIIIMSYMRGGKCSCGHRRCY